VTDITKLNEAMAKVLGNQPFYALLNFDHGVSHAEPLSQNWTALMIVVTKLEATGEWLISRSALDNHWNVCRFREKCRPQWSVEYRAEYSDLASEALALAECIYVIVSKKN